MEKKTYLYSRVTIDLDELCELQNAKKTSSGEFVTDCPLCIDNGLNGYGKLYIKSDKKVGYCQRCKSSFINKEKQPNEIIIDNLRTPSFRSNWNPGYYELDKIDVDYYNHSKLYSEAELNYLVKRNPALSNLYKDLGFRFRTNKVVMPFYWESEVFYYQIRSTESRDKAILPYYCPPINNKPLWINPLNKGSEKLVITEGIFGAIGAWLTYNKDVDVLSLQGSYITKYQLWMLDNLSYSEYLIYCDESEISEHVAKTMVDHSSFLYNNYKIIESPFNDPEDDYLKKSVDH